MTLKTIPILFIITLAFACSEEPDDFELIKGEEYFPLEVGKYRNYQLDSITFEPEVSGIARDTSRTFVKEEIVEVFENQEGNEVYRVERFERKSNDEPWEVKLVFSMEQSSEFAFQTENNLRLAKMPFPFSDNKGWEATRFINPDMIFQIAGENIKIYKDWESSFESIGVAEEVGGNQFEVTTVLNQNSEDNPFERRLVREKYAKGVGLVAREMFIFDSDYCNEVPAPTDCQTIAWEDKAEKGFIIKQVILDYN